MAKGREFPAFSLALRGETKPKLRQIQPKSRAVPRIRLNKNAKKCVIIQSLQRGSECPNNQRRRRLLAGRADKMKTELILLLYDELIGGKVVSRKKFCAEHSIAERTFYRYLREITAFLRAHKPSYIVDVSEREGTYFLKKV